ncbi:isoprenylcysteine carboxylmethyltransferase family protein [Candidatus Poribacteria bacterium]|nr:MAG: isoprenylcysteine carboxylmethyltransferase family protein [Candidatus Poribacteria bacterium]
MAQSITSCVSRFTPAIGRLLFRLRSLTAIPFILILIYFSRPTLTSALVGAIPLILGEFLRLWAVGYAGGATRSRSLGAASDLVTTGPYAHVRNPLYLGNLLLSLGVCVIANVYWMIIVLLVGYFVQYLPIIASEEAYLRDFCGPAYQTYYTAVPKFIPRLRSYANPSAHSFSFARALKAEKRTLTAIVCVVGLILGVGRLVHWFTGSLN